MRTRDKMRGRPWLRLMETIRRDIIANGTYGEGHAECQGGIRSEMKTLEEQQDWCMRPRKLRKND